MRNLRRGANLRAAAIAIAVFTFAAVVAILSASERQEITARAPSELTELTGRLTPYAAGSIDTEAGQAAAPTATLVTLDGDRVQVGGVGQAQLLVFLAHWCPACDEELNTLRLLPGDVIPDDVAILAILTAEDPIAPNWPAERWFTRQVEQLTAARDSSESELLDAYGLTAFPAWVALDASGVVQQRAYGVLNLDQIATLARTVSLSR